MPTRSDILLLASYNAAMNERVYAAASTLRQVTTLLSQAGVDVGVTDLLEWIPEYG